VLFFPIDNRSYLFVKSGNLLGDFVNVYCDGSLLWKFALFGERVLRD
jgi:hypothetical protein